MAAGIMIFNARIENYEHSTYAAVKLAASVIQGDDVNRYAITGVRDQHYLEVESKLNMIARYGELKYIYVIIPNENDIVYVWDALGVGSAEELATMKEQKAKIDEHDIYSSGERANCDSHRRI